jgi:hypothetical protein
MKVWRLVCCVGSKLKSLARLSIKRGSITVLGMNEGLGVLGSKGCIEYCNLLPNAGGDSDCGIGRNG